jgi:hypothetical protein
LNERCAFVAPPISNWREDRCTSSLAQRILVEARSCAAGQRDGHLKNKAIETQKKKVRESTQHQIASCRLAQCQVGVRQQ